MDKWFNNLRHGHAKPKFQELHFYIHDILQAVPGKNISIVEVAKAENITDSSPTEFGLVYVVDNKLTAGPEYDSKQVGYVQGLSVSASIENSASTVCLNMIFTQGEYNGSTLSVLGRIARYSDNREFPILGGTGGYRMAQGIATGELYSYDNVTRNAVVECRIRFFHY
ncbi:OLC1v1019706C2 [Oldenlandia corymbosa var. corymbosa]|nr:OLC1v1019706C2 [Oldenlandia corymbosa var. corymbosa]